MFVLRDRYTCTWPVKVKVPTAGGRFDEQRFEATFRLLPMERIQELTEGKDRDQADVAVLREAWIDWSGVTDEGSEAIGFSGEGRDRMLAVSFVRRAAGAAFVEAMGGRLEKN